MIRNAIEFQIIAHLQVRKKMKTSSNTMLVGMCHAAHTWNIATSGIISLLLWYL